MYRHGSALDDDSIVVANTKGKREKQHSATAPSTGKKTSKSSPRGNNPSYSSSRPATKPDNEFSATVSSFRNSVDDMSVTSRAQHSDIKSTKKKKKKTQIGNFSNDKSGLEIIELLSRLVD